MTRTLDDATVATIADRHHEAWRSATPMRRITAELEGLTLDDAYACQRAWVERQVADGSHVVGHKVGLTSKAMQAVMRIDEPDFGALLDHMILDDGAELDTSAYIDPRVEVELAFILGDLLELAPGAGNDPSADRAAVLAATARIAPAVELIDARSFRVDPEDGAPRTVIDTIADNAANAGVLMGTSSIDPESDLGWVGAVMRCNDEVEETGLAAGVLGDPVLGVVWLARRLASFGEKLTAGEIVLAGSFTRPVPCRPGDRFEIDFGSFGTLRLACR